MAMEWEQERYDLKRKLGAEEASRRFLEEEVEVLQNHLKDYESKTETLMKKLKEKEECLEYSQVELKNEVECLHSKLEAERKSHAVITEKMQSQIDELSEEKFGSLSIRDSEAQALKRQCEELMFHVQNLEIKVQNQLQEISEMKKVTDELVQEKGNLEEILMSKREAVQHLEETNAALQEECALLKVENDSLKASSRVGKGNSVFAEVDDNRRALKKNLDALAEKYNNLKKEYRSKCSENLKARTERASLLKEMKEATKKYGFHESALVESHKTRIRELETQVRQLKQSNEEKRLQDKSSDFKALDSLFEAKRLEIDVLKKKAEEQSERLLIQSETIFTLRREMQALSANFMHEKAERLRLQEEYSLRTGENVGDAEVNGGPL